MCQHVGIRAIARRVIDEILENFGIEISEILEYNEILFIFRNIDRLCLTKDQSEIRKLQDKAWERISKLGRKCAEGYSSLSPRDIKRVLEDLKVL